MHDRVKVALLLEGHICLKGLSIGHSIEVYQKLPDEKIPPLVDLDALRERLRLQSEATRERLRLQSEAARAGIEGFLSALQKKDNGQGEE